MDTEREAEKAPEAKCGRCRHRCCCTENNEKSWEHNTGHSLKLKLNISCISRVLLNTEWKSTWRLCPEACLAQTDTCSSSRLLIGWLAAGVESHFFTQRKRLHSHQRISLHTITQIIKENLKPFKTSDIPLCDNCSQSFENYRKCIKNQAECYDSYLCLLLGGDL